MASQKLAALVVVYSALPLIVLIAALDSGTGQRLAELCLLVWSVAALYLLASSAGRDAYAQAFAHQHKRISSAFKRH